MEPGPATTGEAAEEAGQDEESRTELESDAPDYPSGSALYGKFLEQNWGTFLYQHVTLPACE